MMPARGQTRSFTLIELIVVIVITVILAALSVPMLDNGDARRVSRAAHELAAYIKMARDLAMASQRSTWLDFDVSGDSYDMYIEDPDNPGKANRLYVRRPDTGEDFHLVLADTECAGVSIQSVSFQSTDEVEFDWLGRPRDGNSTVLSSDGTVVFSAGGASRTVRVAAHTGMVTEE